MKWCSRIPKFRAPSPRKTPTSNCATGWKASPTRTSAAATRCSFVPPTILMAKNPDWLPQVREFCKSVGITIMAWGPCALVVEANSPEIASQISKQLRQLEFKAVEDEADADAGMLTLSRKP